MRLADRPTSGVRAGVVGWSQAGAIDLGVMAGPVTLFWYLGFINSMNLIDGLDGLASGISVLGALFLAVAAIHPPVDIG